MAAEHRPLTILLVVSTAVVLLITIVFASLTLTQEGEDHLFSDGIGRTDSVDYPNDIKLARWVYRIWIFIFLIQFGWVLYVHTLLCRLNHFTKEYLYYSPPFLPKTMYSIFIMALVMTITFFFTWDSGFLAASFVVMCACFLFLCLCLFFALYLLWHYEKQLNIADMWVNILLLHNGLALYATWAFVEMLISFNVMLAVETEVSQENAGTIALAILLVAFLFYMCCDVFLSRKRLRYMIAPYITLIVALSALVNESWEEGQRNAEFSVAVLAIVIVGCLGKAGTMVYRMVTDPLRIEKMCCSN